MRTLISPGSHLDEQCTPCSHTSARKIPCLTWRLSIMGPAIFGDSPWSGLKGLEEAFLSYTFPHAPRAWRNTFNYQEKDNSGEKNRRHRKKTVERKIKERGRKHWREKYRREERGYRVTSKDLFSKLITK